MAQKFDSINVRIFMALKVSEYSNVPVLIMSNPGVGKTTSVEMYAKLRKDEKGRPMDVVTLRGNAESPEAIHGYETVSTAPVVPGQVVISSHTRPSWMNRILDNYKEGIRTILFLDELTTANEYVQAALLHLIFDRQCGVEELPPISHCLIVAAGNYMNNLSTSMTMISPVLNRFMIFNITPGVEDLGTFLCKYKGAIANGKITDSLAEVEAELAKLDQQELHLSRGDFDKVGEYFEQTISETTRMLATHEHKLDLSVTNLKELYGDVDDDDPNLYGFPTFRTLNYLREVAVACYRCFGKYGIQSANFRTMVDGLVGMGLTKETKSGSSVVIKTHKIGDSFHKQLSQVAIELDKLSSTKLPEYLNYFSDLLNSVSSKDRKKADRDRFTLSDLTAIKNKLEEMCADKEMDQIEKPIEKEMLESICKLLKKTSGNIPTFTYSVEDKDIAKKMEEAGLTVESIMGYVSNFNALADTFNTLVKFIQFDRWNYSSEVKDVVAKASSDIATAGSKLKSIKRLAIANAKHSGSSAIIPEIAILRAVK